MFFCWASCWGEQSGLNTSCNLQEVSLSGGAPAPALGSEQQNSSGYSSSKHKVENPQQGKLLEKNAGIIKIIILIIKKALASLGSITASGSHRLVNKLVSCSASQKLALFWHLELLLFVWSVLVRLSSIEMSWFRRAGLIWTDKSRSDPSGLRGQRSSTHKTPRVAVPFYFV